MKIIKVNTCDECPYIEHNSGMGYGPSFVKCDKFRIMLFNWGGSESFDYRRKIHPKCRLEDS